MLKLFILLFFCAVLVSTEPQNCPSDEVCECRSPCNLTCATLDSPCIQVVVCSCYCQPGYTRFATNGTCIPISSCPSTSG